jgi:hypothetical protein
MACVLHCSSTFAHSTPISVTVAKRHTDATLSGKHHDGLSAPLQEQHDTFYDSTTPKSVTMAQQSHLLCIAEEAEALLSADGGGLPPESPDSFLSAISDEFYDVYSDAYYDTGTP